MGGEQEASGGGQLRVQRDPPPGEEVIRNQDRTENKADKGPFSLGETKGEHTEVEGGDLHDNLLGGVLGRGEGRVLGQGGGEHLL